MRVYIDTDMEGVSGVVLWEQVTKPSTPAYDATRRLLMADVNAAIEGCLEAGAEYVCVLDAHWDGHNFVPEMMHPEAEYVTGKWQALFPGFDESFDCVLMVGYHAMNRVADGVLFHSQSPNNDARYFYNDLEMGEIGQAAMYYGDFGVPVAMVTGDAAVCREARELLGEEVVTVAVKEGYGRQSARCLAPARAHELIRAGAREAIGRVAGLTPLRLQTPVRCRLETSAEPVPAEYTVAQLEAVAHVTRERVVERQRDAYAW